MFAVEVSIMYGLLCMGFPAQRSRQLAVLSRPEWAAALRRDNSTQLDAGLA
jgi:hypothetical protein